MSTQGVVSLVDGEGKTLLKVVVGDNGQQASVCGRVMKRLWEVGEIEMLRYYDEALATGFGCYACLTVMTKDVMVFDGTEIDFRDPHDDGLGGMELYREKFSDSQFNPRWDRGTADYVEVVEVENQ